MRIASFIMLTMAATVAAGQPRDTTVVPKELVHALFGWAGGAEITVASAPRGYPASLVPAGATILGGMRGGFGRALVLAIRVDTAQQSDSLVARMSRDLQNAGWRRPEIPAMRERGGFVASEWSMQPENLFCNDSAMVEVRRGRRTQPRVLTINYTPSVENNICDPRTAERWRGRDPVALPTLIFPLGVDAEQMGGGGGDDFQESRARARTAMAANALNEAMIEQLVEQGWTLITKSGDAEAAIASARKREGEDENLVASVSIFRSSPSHAELQLTVRRLTPERARRSRVPPA